MRSIKNTLDLYPELTPFERHVQFVESLSGPISQTRYSELLKAHFTVKKEKRPMPYTEKSVTLKSLLINFFTLK